MKFWIPLICFCLSVSILQAQVGRDGLRDFLMVTAPGTEKLIDNNAATKTEEVKEVVKKTDGALSIHQSLMNPRKTMEVFLDSMNNYKKVSKNSDEYLNQAILTIDLSSIEPSIRINYGKQIAEKLIFIFDRMKYVDLNEISDSPDAQKWIYLQKEFKDGEETVVGEIAIEKSSDNVWKFNSKTVETIDSFYQEAAKLPILEGTIVDRKLDSKLKHFFGTFGQRRIAFFTVGQWLASFIILLFSGLLGLVVKMILVKYLDYLKQKGTFYFSKSEVTKINLPMKLLVFSTVWLTGINLLNFSPSVYAFFHRLFYIMVSLSLVWTVIKTIDILTTHFKYKAGLTPNKFDDTIVPMVSKGSKFLAIIFGSVLVAHALTFDIRGLLAGLGLGGIAVALASKDTIANLFATITVIIDRPFQIGDYVYMGGYEGTVEDVGFRSTRIRTPERSILSIPNSSIANMAIDNYGVRYSRRFKATIQFDLSSKTADIENFCRQLNTYCQAQELVDKNGITIYFKEIKDKAINVFISVYLKTTSGNIEVEEVHKMNTQILKIVEKIGIELVNNNNTVILKQDNELTNSTPNV